MPLKPEIERNSNEQGNAERTRPQLVVVTCILSVPNRAAAVKVDAHCVAQADDGQKCKDTGNPERCRRGVVAKVEERHRDGPNVDGIFELS